MRIAVDLITAADGRQLWSETYDRELKDIFAVQSEIAAAVAGQLKLKLLGNTIVHATTRDPSLPAYTALLQGAHLLPNFNETDLRKAIVYFEEATRLDPDYALAYAQLANAWRALSALYLSEPDEIADGYRRARTAAETALRLAPELAEARIALGYVKLTGTSISPAQKRSSAVQPRLRPAITGPSIRWATSPRRTGVWTRPRRWRAVRSSSIRCRSRRCSTSRASKWRRTVSTPPSEPAQGDLAAADAIARLRVSHADRSDEERSRCGAARCRARAGRFSGTTTPTRWRRSAKAIARRPMRL